MKKLFTFLALAIGIVSASFAQLATTFGGPDDYGYSWVSSDDSSGTPNKPTFNWVDISTTGTRILGYGDDQGPGAMLPIGFNFPFYWYNINQFYVGANGYIRFTSPLDVSSDGAGGKSFPDLPLNDAYNDWVCPFLCDLNPTAAGGGKIYYKTNGTDQLIVSYVDVPFWGSQTVDYQGSNTFQVIFSLADTSITFQYLKQNGVWGASYNTNANPIIIGIEGKAGQSGLMVSNLEKPKANLAIKFTVKKESTFSLTDITLDWQKNNLNAAVFGMVEKPTWINVNVSNAGDSDVNSDIKVKTTIEKYSLGQLSSTNVFKPSTTNEFTISALAAGASQEYTYAEAFIPADLLSGNPSQGTYIITSNTTFNDGVSENNKVETEFVILDNKIDSLNLNYYNVPDLENSDPVGTFGFVSGGIYIDLPFYPVTLKEIHMYVSTDGDPASDGMTVEVFSRGANGVVGDLLYSSYVDKALLKYPAAATDPMLPTIVAGIEDNSGKPIVINDKGFYLSFTKAQADGDENYALFEDLAKPFSFRTYEVNGGLWGNYRQAASGDPMIGAVVDATNATTGITKPIIADKIEVGNAYPNPTSGLTSIDFTLNEIANVKFTLSNVIGQNVDVKSFGTLSFGKHQINFDASKLESGVYFYTVEVDGQKTTKKLVVK